MLLPTLSQIRGIVIIVNTALPLIVLLTFAFIYAFHIGPLLKDLGKPFSIDSGRFHEIRKQYNETKITVKNSYKPISDISKELALLASKACNKSEIDRLLNSLTNSSASGVSLIRHRQPYFIRAEFHESIELPDPRPIQESIELPDPGSIRGPSPRPNPIIENPIGSPLNPGNVWDAIKKLQTDMSNLPENPCDAVKSQFVATFSILNKFTSLFDSIKAALSQLESYLKTHFKDVYEKLVRLYNVLEIVGIALFVWLGISYTVWISGRLQQGWNMVAAKEE